jgi:hypothetical protein
MKKTMLGFYEAATVANKVAGRYIENEEFQLIYSGYKVNYKKYDDFEDYMENFLTSYAYEQFWNKQAEMRTSEYFRFVAATNQN